MAASLAHALIVVVDRAHRGLYFDYNSADFDRD